jgi:hypothetical protein
VALVSEVYREADLLNGSLDIQIQTSVKRFVVDLEYHEL